MKKYMLRYLLFWLPGFLLVSIWNNASMTSQVLQWFFAFFMLFGWSTNTGMMTYHYPRQTLGVLLFYLAATVLLTVALYASPYDSALHGVFMFLAGALSFTPLTIFIMAIIDLAIPHEIYITALLVASCLIGYLGGLAVRRMQIAARE